MMLLTKEHTGQLLRNGGERRDDPENKPVVKFFTPWTNCTWLISEMDPDDHDRLFGLCDLSQGFPELGYLSMSEVTAIRGPAGLRIERDRWFRPAKTLAEYANEARAVSHIAA